MFDRIDWNLNRMKRRNTSVAVMSVYDANPEHLKAQIDSILAQDLPVDLYIRDDGSRNENTIIVLDSYSSFPNVHIVHGDNLGFVRSFFEALSAVVGNYRYYFLCDQDDYWLANRTRNAVEQMRKIEQEEVGSSIPLLCHTRFCFSDNKLNVIENQRITFQPSFAEALSEIPVPGMAMCVNDALLTLSLPLSDYFIPGHDWWLYLIANAFGKVIEDPEMTLYYRRHEHNVSTYNTNKLDILIHRIREFVLKDSLASLRNMYIQFFDLFSEQADFKPGDKDLLECFLPPASILKSMKKALYPHRYRSTFFEEIGFRLIIILGRL